MPPASKRKKSASQSPKTRQPAPAAGESGAEDQEEPQAGPSSRSRMPPPQAAPKRLGYRCKLCRKTFYDFNEFNQHKRVIHQIAASLITVAPDQVSITSEDAPSLDGDEEFARPSEAAPVQRRSQRTTDASTAVREAAVDPSKVPSNARTRNQLPPAFNDKDRAQSKKDVRVPKFKGV